MLSRIMPAGARPEPPIFATGEFGQLRIAAVHFDRSGTTRIGKYVLNHSFMLPGIVSTAVAVTTGLVIAKVFF